MPRRASVCIVEVIRRVAPAASQRVAPPPARLIPAPFLDISGEIIGAIAAQGAGASDRPRSVAVIASKRDQRSARGRAVRYRTPVKDRGQRLAGKFRIGRCLVSLAYPDM